MTEQIQIAISCDVLTEVHRAVDSGEFESTSEIVEQALRSWNTDRMYQFLTASNKEEIGRLWDEAKADPSPPVDAEGILERLQQRYCTKAAEQV